MKPYYNDKNELCMNFGKYVVIQKRKNFNAIYFEGERLTHSTRWNKATKIAKLLNQAYEEGYNMAKSW